MKFLANLVGEVGDGADGGLEGGRVDVGGDGDDDVHGVGDGAGLELALGLCVRVREGVGSVGRSGQRVRKRRRERTLIMYSMREWECGSTTASTQMSGLTCVESRYVMRSNSPSGGMKEMVRSFSKRARRTH